MIVELLEAEIRSRGPVSFARFMEFALYHPQLGYYSRNLAGRDYYTSADVHPVFAGALAQFFCKEWEGAGGGPTTIVELGSGEGKVCRGVLSWAQENAPEFYRALTYRCVEIGAERRLRCGEAVQPFPGKAEVRPAFDFAPGSIRGIVFSNEFFDALPFHRVRNKGGAVHEILVGPGFREVEQKAQGPVLEYMEWLGARPEEGCIGEAHVQARDWMRSIARSLGRGAVLTIDYGYESPDLYAPIRPEGTTLCHHAHGTHRDFYREPGNQDITAHVNFSALVRAGEELGLRAERLKTQSQFLLENGLESLLAAVSRSAGSRARLKSSAAVKSLIHPEGMGGTFKALVQRKP